MTANPPGPQPKPAIALATGGTGGHVFPALAFAEYLRAAGHSLLVFMDRRAADSYGRLLSPGELEIVAAASPFRRPGMALGAVPSLASGILQSFRTLARAAPVAITGFGSYASIPPLIAARCLGIPVFLHEQNAVLGRSHRFLARMARGLALSFPATAGISPSLQGSERLCVTGVPVRSAVLVRGRPYQPPAGRGPLRLVVLGGSLGAGVFADVVPGALGHMAPELRKRLEIAHQARPEDIPALVAGYGEAGIQARVQPFFEDIPDLLSGAHLLVGRSGASTVSELCVLGLPSVLVPFPGALDDHQTANARFMQEAGAAILLPQDECDAAVLAGWLGHLLLSPGRLERMASAALAAGTPGAAGQLYSFLCGRLA